MIKINLEQIEQITEGQWINTPSFPVERIEIDSRNVDQSSLFIPILGEVHDGHKFILSAFEQNTLCSMCEKSYYYTHQELKGLPLLLVDDTTSALHRLTSHILKVVGPKVVGITGSVGKTSTKEFVYHVLKDHYNVHKNKGNFNNHIGMPLTIMDLTLDHNIAILEMGMNHFKEILTLADIARPDVGVITNIGTSHIGILGSKENIFQAKMEIVSYFDERNTLIVNAEDDYLKDIESNQFKVVHVGKDLVAEHLRLQDNGCYAFDIKYNNQSEMVKLNVLGKHNVINSLLAAAVGLTFKLSLKDIVKGLESFDDIEKRLTSYKETWGVIISDCYNASQESVLSALEVLQHQGGKRIAILGDILELGEYAESSHRWIGERLIDQADEVWTFGQDSKWILKATKVEGRHYDDQTQLIEDLKKELKDVSILVKGSQGMAMHNIVNALRGE